MNVRVRTATCNDLGEVLRVQRQAFGRIAMGLCLQAEDLPTLKESLDDLQQQFDDGVVFFVAEDDAGRVVGTVRGTLDGDSVYIGRLAVADGCTRMGVATALMGGLEDHFPDAGRFDLFTGADASAPLALYAKLGYHVTHEELRNGIQLVWLCKSLADSADSALAEEGSDHL